MQRVAGQYVVKRFADQLLGSEEKQAQQQGAPEQPHYQQAPPSQAGAPVPVSGGELDGEMIYDDENNRLGIARHVAEISVYVVSHSKNELGRTLRQAVEDPESEVRFAFDNNGRITGLIYVPSGARGNQNIRGTRLDDV
ncbi:MAG TPA: hypothetical protein VGT61_03665 [Thermomicrobiales bacterium]|jgi:hypothetical protein|nr:hypothetical protein [Thermomicrobiales bacterium]